MSDKYQIRAAIKAVPDFPEEGVIFRDITPLLADPDLFQKAIALLAATAGDQKIDKVAGIDARGFIFGSAVALALGAGFVPLRKKGKLPRPTHQLSYQLEYGLETLEVHQDAFSPGEKVLLIDDLLATGGTAGAAAKLISEAQAELVSASFLIELPELCGRRNLGSIPVNSLISF